MHKTQRLTNAACGHEGRPGSEAAPSFCSGGAESTKSERAAQAGTKPTQGRGKGPGGFPTGPAASHQDEHGHALVFFSR